MNTSLNAQRLADSWRAWVRYDIEPPKPRALQWLWTALFSLALALGFTLLGLLTFAPHAGAWSGVGGFGHWFGKNLVVTGTIGALIHLMFDALAPWGRPRMPQWNAVQRAAFFAGVPMLGVAVGWPLGMWLAGGDIAAWFGSRGGKTLVLTSVLASLAICFVIYQFFSSKAAQYLAEQRATEAQLRLLQAQIEPHFLFNTLANVHSLIEHDAAKAKRMLGAFTDYLRASFTGMRRDEATVADELALAEAYLQVQSARMDERLRWHIEADAAARRATMLPLLLQPLVENALHHGLERKMEGGRIEIKARVEGAQLHVEVRDDGLGLDAPPRCADNAAGTPGAGSGLALANLRERLAARFGNAASLELVRTEPGAVARLRMPLVSAAPSSSSPC